LFYHCHFPAAQTVGVTVAPVNPKAPQAPVG